MPQPLPILIDRLTKTYGNQRGIQNIDLTVERGEVFGLLGPTGAGKTTTIRLVIGLLRPTSGGARIFGRDSWTRSGRAHREVGFIPADLRLYEQLGVMEFLRFMARLHGGVKRGRIEGLAERLELDLRDQIRHLSAANRQKVGLVQALMHEAPLLILDEPGTGLDPLIEVVFMQLLREERTAGRTVFLSSHNLSEVERVCDRVAIIRNGKLVLVEQVEALKANRVHEITITFRQPIDPRGFETDGIVILERSDRRIRMAVRGDLNPLIRSLARYDVQDLATREPSLEDIFLHYYQGRPAERASA
ncbi:MAG: ABC transporter ATP-binding protein [Candidatus Dormibacteraeota bacterium]|nr:ABC transporter ATP-binding protein [Candidatus Dormibacteraeota bacterium]